MKVKLKFDDANIKKEKYSQKFLDFIAKNKDTIFTATQEKKYKGTDIYTLKENDIWLFHRVNLEQVRENRKNGE